MVEAGRRTGPGDFERLEHLSFIEPYIVAPIPQRVIVESAAEFIDDFLEGTPMETLAKESLARSEGFLVRPEFYQHERLRKLGVNSPDQVGRYIAAGGNIARHVMHQGVNVGGDTLPSFRPVITLAYTPEREDHVQRTLQSLIHENIHAMAVKDGLASGIFTPGVDGFRGFNEALTTLFMVSTYAVGLGGVVDPGFDDFDRVREAPAYGPQMVAALQAIRLTDLGPYPLEADDLIRHFFSPELSGETLMEDLVSRIPKPVLEEQRTQAILSRAISMQ